MPTSQTAAVIALLELKVVPAKQLAEQLATEGSATDMLNAHLDGVGDALFTTEARQAVDLEAIDAQIADWAAEGIHTLSVFDEDYPLNLRAVYDRPALLFVRGQLDERDAASVAVVGTRNASPEGVRRARKIAIQLVDAGYVVNSGLAAGIDTAAHTATIDAGGRTVAVIGTGHRHSFPKANADLQRYIAQSSAVISQFRPDQGGRPWTFPLRNAVMSGISLATVVVEASHTSGARMQARIALEHGRPVFLLRSLVNDHEWAQQFATRPGARIVDDIDDVVTQLQRIYAPVAI